MQERRNYISALFFPVKLNHVLTIIMLGMISFAAVMSYLMIELGLLFDGTFEPKNIGQAQAFEHHLNQLKVVIPFAFILFTLFVGYLSVSIVRHIKGEMVAINAQIDHMLMGETDYKRRLREGDNFHETMDKLHKLSEKLKGK